jgi:hypothetical protein
MLKLESIARLGWVSLGKRSCDRVLKGKRSMDDSSMRSRSEGCIQYADAPGSWCSVVFARLLEP